MENKTTPPIATEQIVRSGGGAHAPTLLTMENARSLAFGMPYPLCFATCSILEYNISGQSDGKVHFRS